MQIRQKRASDKRAKLIQSGAELFHRNGYDGTSLANVAKAAGLPAGGIFYHFPSKSDLAEAVMARYVLQFGAELQEIEASTPSPRDRLRLFWDQAETLAESRAELGCPVLALAQDLGADPALPASKQPLRQEVMQQTVAWLAQQYGALGLATEDADLEAARLFATLQGAFALGHVMGDADLIRRLFERERHHQQKAGYR